MAKQESKEQTEIPLIIEEKRTILEKLSEAKKEIKETKIKKEGRNAFSNYDYFTPSQIEYLVQSVCQNHKLLTKFDLRRNELGVTGELTIFDLESAEKLIFEMASAIPEIKATNIAQQLGGCVTYTERYLKTSAFGITDNNLDFDNNTQPPAKVTQPAQPIQPMNPTPEIAKKPELIMYKDAAKTELTENFNKVVEALKSKKATVTQVKTKYTLTNEMESLLLDIENG